MKKGQSTKAGRFNLEFIDLVISVASELRPWRRTPAGRKVECLYVGALTDTSGRFTFINIWNSLFARTHDHNKENIAMNKSFQFTKLFAVVFVVVNAFVAGGRTVSASSCTPATAGNLCASYSLSGVTLTAKSVNGSPAFGTPPSAIMSGQFAWEYTPGDFANGNGTFTSLVVPWTSHGMGSLILSIDTVSLNGTLPGNIHGDGVDFMIAMSPGLSSPTQGSGINYPSSVFDIWGSNGSEYVGNVTSGSVVVSTVPLPSALWLFSAGIVGLIGGVKNKQARRMGVLGSPHQEH